MNRKELKEKHEQDRDSRRKRLEEQLDKLEKTCNTKKKGKKLAA